MFKNWYDVFPEISIINNINLQHKVIEVCEEALNIGGWSLEDVDKIPFTLEIPNTCISYRMHVRAVTKMVIKIAEEWQIYGDKYILNKDNLIAGAILHDVGKLIEYEKDIHGNIKKSSLGKNLRHPFSGCALAVKHNIPYEIAHIIANHAKEGDGTLRSPEAVIVNKCDMLNFTVLKSFSGIL